MYWIDFFEPIDCCVTPVLTLAEARKHRFFCAMTPHKR
jgi:hypothetical protein